MVLLGGTYKEKYFDNDFYNVKEIEQNKFEITDKDNNKGLLMVLENKAVLVTDNSMLYFNEEGKEIIGVSKKAEENYWKFI